MGITLFLCQLQESGNVVLEDPSEPRDAELEQCNGALVDMDRVVRPALAWDPPELSLPAARWAVEVLYGISRALVFREMDVEVEKKGSGVLCRNGPEGASHKRLLTSFSRPCPEAPSPRSCYSVDLTFQYLPDIFPLAHTLAPGDPLVDGLRRIAREWPLSSVGIAELGEVSTDAFWDSPSLRQLYIDRILSRKDCSRLSSDRVRKAARESLGFYPDLCPEIADVLAREEST